VQRRASAQLTETESVPDKVRFGVTVALEFADGTQKNFTLVGEDEADPNAGLISWISPVAQALLGREVGDEIELPSGRAEIIGLSNTQLQ
jgi:transcription elongation GreA/GreB family factor